MDVQAAYEAKYKRRDQAARVIQVRMMPNCGYQADQVWDTEFSLPFLSGSMARLQAETQFPEAPGETFKPDQHYH